jgi:hypothetical protein
VNSTLIESRKWFQVVVALQSMAVAVACYLLVEAALPASAGGAKLALLLLAWGAFYGFDRALTRVLPIVILKAWPGLESPDRPTSTS